MITALGDLLSYALSPADLFGGKAPVGALIGLLE